jgi:deazaflavin-dependent oxidoreductase (nitroreductase family)
MATTRSRGRVYNRPIATLQRVATRLHNSLYRATAGRIGGGIPGSGPVLLLTTNGRKTGRERTVPLLYLRDGEDIVLVASNGGTATHPAWWLNLAANPVATVELGDRRLHVRAREAGPEEKERLWPRLVEMYGAYEDYQRKTDREIPVVLLHPVNG